MNKALTGGGGGRGGGAGRGSLSAAVAAVVAAAYGGHASLSFQLSCLEAPGVIASCQYTATGWDSKFHLQIQSHCSGT